MPSVEVCFTPEDYHLYEKGNQAVVVIDVLRATSVICSALYHGVSKVIPVESLEVASEYLDKGYLVAGERNGKKIEEFALGNSPLAFISGEYHGHELVISTTNGTRAINTALKAKQLLIGSLLNAESVAQHLLTQEMDVLLLCSGWKGKTNLEDSICAGYIAHMLKESKRFTSEEDSSLIAINLFESARSNPYAFLKGSSHRRRLLKLGLSNDIKYCLKANALNIVPYYSSGIICKL
jgi:2-phosphosulfolactate phosphatase